MKTGRSATTGDTIKAENGRRSRRLASLLLASTISGYVSINLSFAQEQQGPRLAAASQTIQFSIPSQSLASAINAFIRQTGWQISYTSALATGKSSSAVVGSHTPAQALQQMVAGTGLSVRMSAPGSAALVNPGNAAIDAVNTDGAVVLNTINVTGSNGFSADTPYETAGSSTYISQEQIERFRGTSTGDLLSGTPGVLNADNRNGAALDVNIRGMQGQGRSPVIVDGARQETTVYRGYSGVAGRSYVDPDFIGEVVVEKGPSATVDGAGVIGGVVRMKTLTVNDILLPDKNFGIRLKGGFNSNSSSVPPVGTWGGLSGGGNYPNDSIPSSFGGPEGMDRPGFLEPTGGSGSIAAAYRSDYVDLVAGYARRKNGNYHAGTRGSGVPQPSIKPREIWQDGQWVDSPTESTVSFPGLNRFRAGEEVLNTSQDNMSVLLKGTIRLPYDQQVDLSYMRYESDYGEIMPSQILWNPGGGAYQAWLNRVEMDTYTAKYKWDPAENDLIKLNIGLWATRADITLPYQWYGTDQTPAPELENWFGSLNKRWGVNIDNTSAFDTAWGSVTLNYGGSYTFETIEPGIGADEKGRRGDRRELSLFTSGEWKPTDWLTLNAALRYSDFHSNDKEWVSGTTYYYTIDDGNGGTVEITGEEYRAFPIPRPPVLSSRFENWTRDDPSNYKKYEDSGLAPIISATVEPWDGIQFYGKYAEAKRLPSLFETTRGWSAAPTSLSLEPEHAKTWEAGLNVLRKDIFVGGDRLGLKASYFDNHVDNYITRTDTPEGNMLMVNVDKAVLRGFELSGSYDTGRFFADLAYTRYTSTEFCVKPGQIRNPDYLDQLCNEGGVSNSYIVNQLPPRDSVSLTLGARAFDEKMTVGGRLTYIGKRPVSGLGGIAGTGLITHVEWKPYTVVDLFASYKVNEQFQIDAAIDNVTDTYYMDALTLGLMASPGRTFRLNMTAKF